MKGTYMKNRDKLIKIAVTAFLALTTAQTTSAATTDSSSQNSEKCYGLVKAGMNDCSTATSSCAGSSTKDKQADAFVFVPKGLCTKLSGGSLTAGPAKN